MTTFGLILAQRFSPRPLNYQGVILTSPEFDLPDGPDRAAKFFAGAAKVANAELAAVGETDRHFEALHGSASRCARRLTDRMKRGRVWA